MKSCLKRLAEVYAKHPEWPVTFDNRFKAKGFSVSQLAEEGLSERDLKRLERFGLAIRGRTYNGKLEAVELADKRVVYERNFGDGSVTKWVLLKSS